MLRNRHSRDVKLGTARSPSSNAALGEPKLGSQSGSERAAEIPPPPPGRAAESTLRRPTAKASHGGAYEEGGFWYRNNLCVCQACYDSAHAEDQHGSRSLPQTESWLPEGWLLSDLHKYLGFVGKQRRGQQVGQQREEAERLRLQRSSPLIWLTNRSPWKRSWPVGACVLAVWRRAPG